MTCMLIITKSLSDRSVFIFELSKATSASYMYGSVSVICNCSLHVCMLESFVNDDFLYTRVKMSLVRPLVITNAKYIKK